MLRRYTVMGTYKNGEGAGITVKADCKKNARIQAENWFATNESGRGFKVAYIEDNGPVGDDKGYIVMGER